MAECPECGQDGAEREAFRGSWFVCETDDCRVLSFLPA